MIGLLLKRQILAAKTHDTDVMVRVSKGGYSDYIRPLELDAAGIMVPHVKSLAEAEEIVYMTKFHPIGRRPVDGGNADGDYTGMGFKEYIAAANKERFITIQIEDPEPLKELEAIAKLDGIDMLFFGPADFTQGIGHPGEFDHPLVQETRIQIAKLCRQNGKYAGTVGNSSNLDELKEMGYMFVSIGADVVALKDYYEGIADTFKSYGTNKNDNDSIYKE